MKMIFVVFVISENGKHFAKADTIRTGENLLCHIRRYNCEVVHLCESRKEAEQIAIEWNNTYKENGTYLYD